MATQKFVIMNERNDDYIFLFVLGDGGVRRGGAAAWRRRAEASQTKNF
jgi:hypothetical protein